MSVNPIEENSTPKTTGSLEELFRHHLGDEAAVPPRPMLWDQIDNSLLVRQNEVYRSRLAATRWVAAASLLLATLAGTGWWARRDTNLGGAGVAVVTDSRSATGLAAGAGSKSALQSASAIPSAANRNDSNPSVGAAVSGSKLAQPSAGHRIRNNELAQPSRLAARASGTNAASLSTGEETVAYHAAPTRAGETTSQPMATKQLDAFGDSSDSSASLATNNNAGAVAPEQLISANQATGQGLNRGATQLAQGTAGVAVTAPSGLGVAGGTGAAEAAATGSAGVASLATGQASAVLLGDTAPLNTAVAVLAPIEAAPLPGGLAAHPVSEVPQVAARGKWSYGAAYARGLFNPNINFSRTGIDSEYAYNTGLAFGPESPALTEAAAAEYRANLRPGLSQRIALLATRHLRGHWSLSTGAELNQSVAQSSSTAYFVGEQLFNPDLFQAKSAQPRATSFRYRLASVPMEVRYDNPAKKGWSLYGRLGGVVSALLNVRSEVEGAAEATRTYSIASAGTPYRRVTGSVRGGAGARFGTDSGKWALTLGPVAELGVLSLNAHPAQDFAGQSRPYSVGFEAGVEFGR